MSPCAYIPHLPLSRTCLLTAYLTSDPTYPIYPVWCYFHLAFIPPCVKSGLIWYQQEFPGSPRCLNYSRLWITWWKQLVIFDFSLAGWLAILSKCLHLLPLCHFCGAQIFIHVFPSVIWALHPVHVTSDTKIQKYPKRAYLDSTSNFSNKSKDSEINSCKDAVNTWAGHSTQGLTWEDSGRKEEEMQPSNSTNSDAGDNRGKTILNRKVDTKEILIY